MPDLQSIGAVVDDQFGLTIDRDRIVAGRAPNPSVADEIAIGEGLAKLLHLGVGDYLDAASYTPDQIAAILGGVGDAGAFAGPAIRLQIVGVSRRPLDLSFTGAASGLLVLTPAFEREYADRVGQFGGRVRIRVRDGTDVEAVETAAMDVFGGAGFTTQRLAYETEGARATTHILALALWLFAGTGLPPTMANGARMALEPGKGRAAVPVRSASIAAVFGMASVTAVLVFASSLGHLGATPRLYGWTWDFKVLDYTSNTPCGAGDYGLAQVPGITAAAEVCYQVLAVDGRPVPGLAFTTLSGAPIGPEVIDGRAPTGANEVAWTFDLAHQIDGPATADSCLQQVIEAAR